MYFHLPDHIYSTYFNDSIVLLDLIKDKYLILQKEESEILGLALKNDFDALGSRYLPATKSDLDAVPAGFAETIHLFQESDILSPLIHDQKYSFVPKKHDSSGAPNLDWRMSTPTEENISFKLLLEAYFALMKVNLVLKTRGFYGLIKIIKKKRKTKEYSYKDFEWNLLVSALNRACLLYASRTKCLEWAATLTLMGLACSWKCNLVIGVQNFPFQAHAWVQSGKNVIADDTSLPKNLAIILSEPFREETR